MAAIPNTQFYTWKNYRCAYEHYAPDVPKTQVSTPLLLIHPSRAGKQDTPDQRLADYLQCLPQSEGVKIAGRNVLLYESTPEFVAAIAP